MRKKENHHQSKVRNRSIHRAHGPTTINLEYLQELADGDQHFIIEVIEMFINDAPAVLQQALVYHKSGNYPLLKVSVHKLKSSIRMMGDESLASLAQEIETLASYETPHDVISPELHQFTRGVKKLVEGLYAELKKLKAKEETPQTPTERAL